MSARSVNPSGVSLRYPGDPCSVLLCPGVFPRMIHGILIIHTVFCSASVNHSLASKFPPPQKKRGSLSVTIYGTVAYMGDHYHLSLQMFGLFVYLGFYVAFNTVQVISRRVVGRAEETSTYSSLGFCTVNCRPTASNYQLSHLRP